MSDDARGLSRPEVTFERDRDAYGIDPHLYSPLELVGMRAYGDEMSTFINCWMTAFAGTESADEHSGNGDDLRRLDEVLEEQRQRIVALGRRG